jgi:hypothetical protein
MKAKEMVEQVISGRNPKEVLEYDQDAAKAAADELKKKKLDRPTRMTIQKDFDRAGLDGNGRFRKASDGYSIA